MLSQLFDQADENADSYLTTEEFKALVEQMGGICSILQTLGWMNGPGASEDEQAKYIAAAVEKEAQYEAMLEEIRTKYRNAVVLGQFTLLMSRFAP